MIRCFHFDCDQGLDETKTYVSYHDLLSELAQSPVRTINFELALKRASVIGYKKSGSVIFAVEAEELMRMITEQFQEEIALAAISELRSLFNLNHEYLRITR